LLGDSFRYTGANHIPDSSPSEIVNNLLCKPAFLRAVNRDLRISFIGPVPI
jgi:hypothetical protein